MDPDDDDDGRIARKKGKRSENKTHTEKKNFLLPLFGPGTGTNKNQTKRLRLFAVIFHLLDGARERTHIQSTGGVLIWPDLTLYYVAVVEAEATETVRYYIDDEEYVCHQAGEHKSMMKMMMMMMKEGRQRAHTLRIRGYLDLSEVYDSYIISFCVNREGRHEPPNDRPTITFMNDYDVRLYVLLYVGMKWSRVSL